MRLGEQLTLLVNFRNRGDNFYNITHVHASLRSAFDYSYLINNVGAPCTPAQRDSRMTLGPARAQFTAWPVDVAVGPSQASRPAARCQT
jgi:hypothetical protein